MATPNPFQTIKSLFESRKDQLAAVMPKHLTPERLIKVALNCISKTPKLQLCTAASLMQCMVTAAELGLEPGGALGHYYLVPFDDKKANATICTGIIGYRGYIELSRRSGQLMQIEAHVVHQKDEFRLEFGLNPVLRHVPLLNADAGPPTLVYMVARLKDDAVHCEAMTWPEVLRIKARSKAKDFGPWTTDEEEMAKKTVVRRGMKYMPLSAELARAFEHDDEGETVEGEISRAALPADTALTQEIISPANERAKAALSSRMTIKDVPNGEPPEGMLLPGQEGYQSPPEDAA